MRIRPTSKLGRASCWLALAFVGWVVLTLVLALVEARDRQLVSTPFFVAHVVAGYSIGVAASIVALVVMVRGKDRAVLLFACLLPGILVLAILVFELFVEH